MAAVIVSSGRKLSSVHNGGIDAFVAAVDTTLSGTASLIYSTYLSGNGLDVGYGVALDREGNAYVAGQTSSTTFITTTGGLRRRKAGVGRTRSGRGWARRG
jgi:hypothetical protein